MAPSAGVSIGWDQLYGRGLQCHFLPFGDQDLISSCSQRSRCLPCGLPRGQGRQEGREGTVMPQGPVATGPSRPQPQVADVQRRWRSQLGAACVGAGSSAPFPDRLVSSRISDVLSD